MPPSKEKPYKFKNPDLEDPAKAANILPKKKGNIPRLAVMLGLIEVKYYELYLACTGDKTVSQLAEEFQGKSVNLAMMVDKLLKNGLINV
jgi:hypothetical protein